MNKQQALILTSVKLTTSSVRAALNEPISHVSMQMFSFPIGVNQHRHILIHARYLPVDGEPAGEGVCMEGEELPDCVWIERACCIFTMWGQ